MDRSALSRSSIRPPRWASLRSATYLARADAKVNDEQLEERQRRLDQLERDLAEREHALRGGDVRWWGSDAASSH